MCTVWKLCLFIIQDSLFHEAVLNLLLQQNGLSPPWMLACHVPLSPLGPWEAS